MLGLTVRSSHGGTAGSAIQIVPASRWCSPRMANVAAGKRGLATLSGGHNPSHPSLEGDMICVRYRPLCLQTAVVLLLTAIASISAWSLSCLAACAAAAACAAFAAGWAAAGPAVPVPGPQSTDVTPVICPPPRRGLPPSHRANRPATSRSVKTDGSWDYEGVLRKRGHWMVG